MHLGKQGRVTFWALTEAKRQGASSDAPAPHHLRRDYKIRWDIESILGTNPNG
jgi:hypothetical protein